MSFNPNYDSELCGKVPIHLINTVQPYGALLVLERANLELIQASENIEIIFGFPVQTLISSGIGNHLDEKSFELLQELAAGSNKDKIPKVWTIGGRSYLALLHVKEKYILVELELRPHQEEEQHSFISVFQEVKYSMALIENAGSTKEVCEIAAQELKRISGFDKVMIYSFDQEWNGTVLAEEMEEDMESYYGFTFPASDIPRQARQLYLRNPYRFIPDRNYQPVKLYPVINPATHSFIDLSDCNVRGVVAVHLEYLANMGVCASMSTRILNNDQLWGLIACHHKTPKNLSFEDCSIFELLSNVISAKINSIQNKERHEAFTRNRDIYSQILEQVYATTDLVSGLIDGEKNVLQLFGASAAVLVNNGTVTIEGNAPTSDQLEELILWLHTRRLNHPLHTDSLGSLFERASEWREYASGLLAIPFQPEMDAFLLLFRPEVKKIIDWGGDPGGRIVFEKDGLNYHPRHSFKLWRQIVSGTSLPWKEDELTIAESMRSFLYEHNHRKI